MPSSLIFVGLVVAWLLILVPIVARRRQEVARPSEAALACRVLERRGVSRRVEEVSGMDEAEPDRQLVEDATADADAANAMADESEATPEPEPAATQDAEPVPRAESEPDATDEIEEEPDTLAEAVFTPEVDPAVEAEPQPEPATAKQGRRYRSGRGGFDPEAAVLAARARYSFRQRVVLALVLAMMATAVGAIVADHILWWGHAGVDVVLVGYLVYLRRQVRIEEDIRLRRAARMAGTRRGRTVAEYVAQRAGDTSSGDALDQQAVDERVKDPALPDLEPLPPEQRAERERAQREDEQPALPPLRPAPLPATPDGTAVIDLDDEDPGLHDLAQPDPPGYRRAVGQ